MLANLFCSFVVCCLLFATLPRTISAEPKCHMVEMERCFDKLHQLREANHDPSHLLTSIDGLNRICRVIKIDFVGCIIGYIQKCGTPLHKELSKVLSEAILEHMEQICSPNSPFRDEIVSVSPCLHDKVLSQKSFQRQCNNPFFTTIAWGEMNAHSPHPDRPVLDYIVDTGCCAYRQWEQCSMPQIVQQCQANGQRILSLIISKLLGGVPDFVCSKQFFAPNTKICHALPELEAQRGQINITYHEDQKFSMFSLLKLFLVRDASA